VALRGLRGAGLRRAARGRPGFVALTLAVGIAARSGTSCSPRQSRARPNRRVRLAFQSERRGVSIPSASFHARCENGESRETP
jgi:hypothetical protein